MKILFMAFHFPPSSTAGVHRSLRFCKYLPENGCLPHVLTREVRADKGGHELLSQVPEGVSITRINSENALSSEQADTPITSSRQSKKKGFLTQIVKPWLRPAWQWMTETPDKHVSWKRDFVEVALNLCQSHKFDALYSSGPPHSLHLAALKIHRKTRIPWVADFRDPWARRPWSTTENPWGQKLLPYYERRVVETARFVVLNTTATLADFRAAHPHVPQDKFVHLPNGLDPELIERVATMPKSTTSEHVPTICHAGSLYGRRDPTTILQAISQLKSRGILVKLQQIGDVAPNIEVVETARRLGITDLVEVLPPMSHSDVLRKMALADAHLVVQPDGPLMVPGKLFEMLAFEQPIIAVCDSPVTAELVNEAGGAVASSRDVPDIATAIEHVLRMRSSEGLRESRVACRSRYDGRALTHRLACLFEQCRQA